jgi:serine/threonine-protein kinase
LEKDPDNRPPDAFVTAKRLQEVAKKVDLQQDSVEPDSRTRAGDDTRVDEQSEAPHQIGATFVRDLMRMDMSSHEPTTFLARTFNNIWVLLFLLIVSLTILSWSFARSTRPIDVVDENAPAKTEAERILQRARWRWKKGADPVAALAQLDGN